MGMIMSTTVAINDEMAKEFADKPGAHLSRAREELGYSVEYVASQLHLRVRIIELLETDQYDKMPQSVFVKGYIRSYAKLLAISSEPLIILFNQYCDKDHKVERTLWQTKRTPTKHERTVRLVTGIIVVVIFIGLSIWWQKNNTSNIGPTKVSNNHVNKKIAPTTKEESSLTQMSTIQSLFKEEPDQINHVVQ